MITRSELNLTLAILRSAELGFLGLVTVTRRQTPFMHGRFPSESAGETGFRARCFLRQPLITWLKVAQRRPRGLVDERRGAMRGVVGARSARRVGAAARGLVSRGSAPKTVRRANMVRVGWLELCGLVGRVLRGGGAERVKRVTIQHPGGNSRATSKTLLL